MVEELCGVSDLYLFLSVFDIEKFFSGRSGVLSNGDDVQCPPNELKNITVQTIWLNSFTGV